MSEPTDTPTLASAIATVRAAGFKVEPIVDWYDRLNAMEASDDLAQVIAAKMWADVTDRRGWRQEASHFDEDVKIEIIDAWVALIRAAMVAAGEVKP